MIAKALKKAKEAVFKPVYTSNKKKQGNLALSGKLFKYSDPENIYNKNGITGGFAVAEIKGDKAIVGCGGYGYWESCRELFETEAWGDTQDTSRYIFFGVKDRSALHNLAYFFTEVSKRLNIDLTVFHETDSAGIALVDVPIFWRKYHYRRQLFTILLRCGVDYTGNFEKALYSNSYAKTSKHAVERFFKGFVYMDKDDDEYMAEFGGWCDYWEENAMEQRAEEIATEKFNEWDKESDFDRIKERELKKQLTKLKKR